MDPTERHALRTQWYLLTANLSNLFIFRYVDMLGIQLWRRLHTCSPRQSFVIMCYFLHLVVFFVLFFLWVYWGFLWSLSSFTRNMRVSVFWSTFFIHLSEKLVWYLLFFTSCRVFFGFYCEFYWCFSVLEYFFFIFQKSLYDIYYF